MPTFIGIVCVIPNVDGETWRVRALFGNVRVVPNFDSGAWRISAFSGSVCMPRAWQVKWISSIDVHPGGDNVICGSYDCRVSWFDMDLSTSPYKTMRSHKVPSSHPPTETTSAHRTCPIPSTRSTHSLKLIHVSIPTQRSSPPTSSPHHSLRYCAYTNLFPCLTKTPLLKWWPDPTLNPLASPVTPHGAPAPAPAHAPSHPHQV